MWHLHWRNTEEKQQDERAWNVKNTGRWLEGLSWWQTYWHDEQDMRGREQQTHWRRKVEEVVNLDGKGFGKGVWECKARVKGTSGLMGI